MSDAPRSESSAGITRAQSWQPIGTAPRDGTLILIWPSKRSRNLAGVDTAYWHQPGNPSAVGFWVSRYAARPTHWMPLPDPPGSDREAHHILETDDAGNPRSHHSAAS
jgi:hypothetical protein